VAVALDLGRLVHPEQIRQAFDSLELMAPGVVPVTRWRPEAGEPVGPADVDAYGGVGRKA
jgi:hypothetical protein